MKASLGEGGVGAELTRDIAHKWRSLTEDERAPYEEMAAKDKKRYALELINWKQRQETASGGAFSRLTPVATTAEPAAWVSAASASRQHPFAATQPPQETKQANDDFQCLSGTFDERQRPEYTDYMQLPPLPAQMRQPTFQSQVGMSPEDCNEFIAQLQNLQPHISDELQGMTVFRQDSQSPPKSRNPRGFDYQLEIRRVANELGHDGVDLIIRLFQDAA